MKETLKQASIRFNNLPGAQSNAERMTFIAGANWQDFEDL